MLEKLKSQLDHALEKLDDLDDYFEDRAEDFSEEMKTSWKATKSQLNHFGDQLQRAGRALEGETDHIALQAHLATMDAHDQWSTLKSGLESAAQNVKRDGRTQLDEAALQAHLAAMDGRDFLNNQGEAIHHQYETARTNLEQTTLKAASDIKDAFDGLIAGLPK